MTEHDATTLRRLLLTFPAHGFRHDSQNDADELLKGAIRAIQAKRGQQLTDQRGKQESTHLFGQEINAEAYATSKADSLLRGVGEAADNIVDRPEHSTLSHDAFPTNVFTGAPTIFRLVRSLGPRECQTP